jgi:hypothetical protein
LASTNLTENFTCKNLNGSFHLLCEFSEEEASETLASLSHEIPSAHFTQHPAAFSAGDKLLLMFVTLSPEVLL